MFALKRCWPFTLVKSRNTKNRLVHFMVKHLVFGVNSTIFLYFLKTIFVVLGGYFYKHIRML